VTELSDFERGLVAGVLIGEGSFGGDGKQPQITLRMHTRHEALFQWLMERFPRTRLYGPYHHGDRSYYQWMARGQALVEDVLPVLESAVSADVDGYAFARLAEMRAKYADFIARAERRAALAAEVRAEEAQEGGEAGRGPGGAERGDAAR
jgi:hypothetical protein